MDDEKYFVKRKLRKCTNCNSKIIASILYGMPAYDEKNKEGYRR
jgi:hypothetical protein